MSRDDEVFVGRYIGQRTFDITGELVERYCGAVDAHRSWYTGPSPFGGPVAPALLLHSEVYRTLDWYLGIYGNLHAKQEWELFQPVMLGDCVTTRSTIIGRYTKRDREYVVNEVTCFGEDGRMLNRGRTHQSFLRELPSDERPVVDKQREKRPERRFDLDEGEVLEEVAGPAKEITLDMCRRFSAGKSYHNDVEEACKLGFPDIVVQGMMPLCFLSEMMTDRFGEGWFAGGRMNVNLVNVVWRGDTLTSRGIVHSITPEGPRRRAELQVWCEKNDGTKVVVGSGSAIMP